MLAWANQQHIKMSYFTVFVFPKIQQIQRQRILPHGVEWCFLHYYHLYALAPTTGNNRSLASKSHEKTNTNITSVTQYFLISLSVALNPKNTEYGTHQLTNMGLHFKNGSHRAAGHHSFQKIQVDTASMLALGLSTCVFIIILNIVPVHPHLWHRAGLEEALDHSNKRAFFSQPCHFFGCCFSKMYLRPACTPQVILIKFWSFIFSCFMTCLCLHSVKVADGRNQL